MYSTILLLLPAVLAANYDVQVGQGGLKYSPSKVTAKSGDTVTFHWSTPDHSVSQSSFDSPCQPMSGGINSGILTTTDKTFVVTIKDSNPVWIYCAEGEHCQDGMSMVINEASGSDTLDAYQAKAATASSGAAPTGVSGGVLGSGSGSSSGTMSGSMMSSGTMTGSMMSSGTMSGSSMMATGSSSMMMSGAATTTMSGMSSGTASAGTASSSHAAAGHVVGDTVAMVGAAAMALLL